ncbi:MAG: glycerol kinase GlpK [Firmicutes bacterium]|nr:glycerol kinase GlpK [Bacillota bacterium]
MKSKYIMALDQGTTSSRCIIYDHDGRIVNMAQREYTQIFPEAGWVEHDPEEIWQSQLSVAKKALESGNISPEQIDSIGITNQRETTIVWEKATGKPVYNAIVWQCRRTAEFCDELKAEGLTESYRYKTGLIIDAYFSGTKLKWILDRVDPDRTRAKAGELLFGTVETWLIWNLTGGRVHVTDYSNASRTMLFNIRTLTWDKEILDRLDIPECMLPQPKECSCIYGETEADLFGIPIRIAGAAGDQQAALFGQACFEEGEVKNTFGTGGFVLLNTGDKIVDSTNGLLSTIAWGIDKKITYALEGSVFTSGATIQWLRDQLGIINSAPEVEQLAEMVADTAGVYLVPAFAGLGAPYWDSYARGAIVGLTRGANKYHIARAALESMAYQTYDLLDAMAHDLGKPIQELKVDGGASENNLLLSFQAGILQCQVKRPECIETTSLGAAYMAGLATGFWSSMDEIKDDWHLDRKFVPEFDENKRNSLVNGWHKAVSRVLDD